MSIEQLIELLALETGKLTRLFAEKRFNDEYDQSKEEVKHIQELIDTRKEVSSTAPPVFEKSPILEDERF